MYPFDPTEWSFLTPSTDPTFILSSPTPTTVMYMRRRDPGWFPLFDAFVQHNYREMVHYLGVIDQYERRYRESFFSDVEGLGDAKDRLAHFFSMKNIYLKNFKEDEKQKLKEESEQYVEAAQALNKVLGHFTEMMDRLRALIKARGSAFNVMSGDGNSAELINKYWQVYATLASVEPQLEPLRKGFKLLYDLDAFEGTTVEGKFKKFQEKRDAAESSIRSTMDIARRMWDTLTQLTEEVERGGFPNGRTAVTLGRIVREVQELLDEIGRAFFEAAQACAEWATANADDLASKKIYLDNPIGGKIYRAVNAFTDMGLGVVRLIELDTGMITTPLGALKTAITTAVEFKDSKQAWDNPDQAGEKIGEAAKFSVIGNSTETADSGVKYSGYGSTGGSLLSSAAPLGDAAAEHIPLVGAGLKIGRGALDLLKIDASTVSTVHEKAELEYAQNMVNTCLGSWNYLGILDFGAGVMFEGRTDRGIRVTIMNKLTGQPMPGWINDLGVFYSDEGTDYTIGLACLAASHDRAARHQAIGAKPAWNGLTFLTRERAGSLDVFKFSGHISFAGREQYDGTGEIRIYYSPTEFRYLYWECDDLPTLALWNIISPYQDQFPDMIEEANGVFELKMISDSWGKLYEEQREKAIELSVCIERWKKWHNEGLIVIAGPYAATLG
jgi:hypothetical protein